MQNLGLRIPHLNQISNGTTAPAQQPTDTSNDVIAAQGNDSLAEFILVDIQMP